MSEPRPVWSSRTKLTVTLSLVALAAYLLYRFSVVLPPLILAVILGYILSPLVGMIEKRFGSRRSIATGLVYLLLFIIVIVLPISIIPSLSDQVAELSLDVQRFLLAMEDLLEQRFVVAGQIINLDDLFQQLVGSLQGILEPVFGQTLSLAIDVISSFIWIIFVLVVSFYLVKDGPELREWLENFVPPFLDFYIKPRKHVPHNTFSSRKCSF